MLVGNAEDHGGNVLKGSIAESLRASGYGVVDFGAHELNHDDHYRDFIIQLAQAIARGDVERGLGLCGCGAGASIAANKVAGVRAGLIHDIIEHAKAILREARFWRRT